MLGVREMLIVLRARDEASRVIRQTGRTMTGLTQAQQDAAMKNMMVGSSLVSTGTAIAGIGAAGTFMFARATQAAVEYNRQAALTRTQIDQAGVSLKRLEDIGSDVAAAIAVPFDQVQTTLFDIFSSMDVSIPEAKMLLEEFSKAAVGGQVDLQDAARATISILNAYHMPASKVNEVNDVMFRLVQKGIGTYEEFSKVIGRVTPSAVRAGQSIRTVAGMMSFLTRNGLSAAMASSSAARALDAMSNPKVVARLEDMGVKVRDAKGEFLPLVDIIGQLSKKFDGLTQPQVAKRLQALFEGAGGTIQARRFLDPAINNIEEFRQRVGEMSRDDTAGKAMEKYKEMAKTPAMQAQLLSNRWKILQQQIGRELIPALMLLVDWIGTVVDWFRNLNPEVRKWLVIGLAVTAVIMVIVGVVMVLVGGFLMLQATLVLVGMTMGTFLAIVGGIALGVVVLVVVVFLVIKYWDQIKAFTIKVWNAILDFLVSVWQAIWQAIDGPVKFIWNLIVTYYTMLWQFWTQVWNAIVTIVKWVWNNIIPIVVGAAKFIWGIISGYMRMVFGFWKWVWNTIKGTVFAVLGIIKELIRIGVQLWYVIIREKVRMIWNFIKIAWAAIKIITKVAWQLIKDYIITPIQTVWSWLQPKIQAVWDNIIQPAWQKIKEGTREAWKFIKEYIVDPIKDAYDGVVEWFNKIKDFIEDWWDRIAGLLGKIRDGLKMVNPLEHFSPSIVDQTMVGYRELNKVTKKGLEDLQRTAERHATAARQKIQQDVVFNTSNLRTPAQHTGMGGTYHNDNRQSMEVKIFTEEIDPARNAAELGWKLMERVR